MTDNIKIFDSNVYSYKGYGYLHELKVQTFIPCNSIGTRIDNISIQGSELR